MDNLICFENLTPKEIEIAKKAIEDSRWKDNYNQRYEMARDILTEAFKEINKLGIEFTVSGGYVYAATKLEDFIRNRTNALK